jgi:hypothetical protein
VSYLRWRSGWNDTRPGRQVTYRSHAEATVRLPFRHLMRSRAAAAALLVGLAPLAAIAQSTTSLLPDATVLPSGTLGVRLLTGFTRFDALLGDGGTRNIGAVLNVDSLSGVQVAQLNVAETGIRDLLRTLNAPSAFAINAGVLDVSANSRVVTAPLILEYGLTSRITLGLVVPLVLTRTTVNGQLNRHIGTANVAPNLARLNNNWSANAALVTSFRSAATGLAGRLASCQATPTGTGCQALLAQQTAVQSLLQTTESFAVGVEGLYGTSQEKPGQTFVPIATTAAQTLINAQIERLKAQYAAFGTTAPTGTIATPFGPGARGDLQRLLTAAGYDTLRSTDHSSIGDISIGTTLQLANTFGDTTGATTRHYRFAVNAAGRIGTGKPAKSNRLFDNPTGYGTFGVILGAAGDLQLNRRVLATAVGSFTKQLGSVEVQRVPHTANNALPFATPVAGTYRAGDVISLAVVPRYRLAGFFTLDGHYALTRIGGDDYTLAGSPSSATEGPIAPFGVAAATTHQVGLGFSYSTIPSGDRGPGRLPFEVSFRHVETVSGSGGPTPKTQQDQIQLRVFFR